MADKPTAYQAAVKPFVDVVRGLGENVLGLGAYAAGAATGLGAAGNELMRAGPDPMGRAAKAWEESQAQAQAVVMPQGMSPSGQQTADIAMAPVLAAKHGVGVAERKGYISPETAFAVDTAIDAVPMLGPAKKLRGMAPKGSQLVRPFEGTPMGSQRGHIEVPGPKEPVASFDVPEPASFYSALDRALAGIERKTGNAQSWRNELTKAMHKFGFSNEELRVRGIEDMLSQAKPGEKITRDALIAKAGEQPMETIVQHKMLGMPDDPHTPKTGIHHMLAREPSGETAQYFEHFRDPYEPSTYHETVMSSPTAGGYRGHFGSTEGLVGDQVAAERILSDRTRTYGVLEQQSDLHKAGRDLGYEGTESPGMKAELAEAARVRDELFDRQLTLRRQLLNELKAAGAIKSDTQGASSWGLDMLLHQINEGYVEVPDSALGTVRQFREASEAYRQAAIAHDELNASGFGKRVPKAVYVGDEFDKHMVRNAVINAINSGYDTISWQMGETVGKRWPGVSKKTGKPRDYRPQYNERMKAEFERILGKQNIGEGRVLDPSETVDSWIRKAPDLYDANMRNAWYVDLPDGKTLGPFHEAPKGAKLAGGGNGADAAYRAALDWRKQFGGEKVFTAKITPEVRHRLLKEGGLPFAKGGKVPESAQKPKGAKAQDMRETDTHFHVGSFKIAKKGLNTKTLEGLRKHFACGGKVKKMAEGDIVPGAEDPSFTGTPPSAMAPLADPAATLAAGAEEQARLNAFQPPAMAAPPMDDFAAQAAAVPQPPPAPVPAGMSPDVRPDLTSQPPEQAAAPVMPQGYAPPGDAATAQIGSPETLDREIQRKVAREGVPEAMEWDYYHNLPKLHSAVATEEKTAYDLVAKAHQDQAAGTKRAAQSVEAQISGMDKLFGEMADDIKNSRINPNKFWESKNTGQLIAGAVGLILGGVGAGMTGGKNLAAEIIEKAIDRDVEAQKANLGKKFNLLSFALQKTNNLVQAEQVTAAILSQATLADVQGRLARLKGDTASVEHELTVQALRSQAAARIDAYRAHAIQNALAKTQLESAIQTLNALNHFYRGDLADAVVRALPKEQREPMARIPVMEPLWKDPRDPTKGQVVDTETGLPKFAPQGRWVAAGDKTRAEQITKDYGAITTAKSALWELKQFAQAHILGAPVNPARAQQAKTRLDLAIASLTPALYGADEKLYNNLTKASESMVPNPASVWGQGWSKTQTAIDEILVHLSNKEAALDATLYSKAPRRWF